jgi:hypothetical protein
MSESICRSALSESYIKRVFNKFKRGYLYKNNDNELVCFVIWVEHNQPHMEYDNFSYMHVLLMCGLKMEFKIGNLIFPDLLKYCRNNSINTIRLEPATNDLREYYKSFGFIDLNTPAKTMELSVIPMKLMTRRNTQKNTSNMRRRTTQKLIISEVPQLAPTIEHIHDEYNNLEASNIV